MEKRKGDWLQTFTGRVIWPLDPRPEEIHIKDIAGPLSKMVRFGGHGLRFLSVAEHSVLIKRATAKLKYGPRLQRQALFHDGSESIIVDVPRPIKPYLTNYKDIEHDIMLTVANKFEFEWPMHPNIKRLDDACLAQEIAENMRQAELAEQWRGKPTLSSMVGIRLEYWSPQRAFDEFMREARSICTPEMLA